MLFIVIDSLLDILAKSAIQFFTKCTPECLTARGNCPWLHFHNEGNFTTDEKALLVTNFSFTIYL